eukprot:gene25763-32252_t
MVINSNDSVRVIMTQEINKIDQHLNKTATVINKTVLEQILKTLQAQNGNHYPQNGGGGSPRGADSSGEETQQEALERERLIEIEREHNDMLYAQQLAEELDREDNVRQMQMQQNQQHSRPPAIQITSPNMNQNHNDSRFSPPNNGHQLTICFQIDPRYLEGRTPQSNRYSQPPSGQQTNNQNNGASLTPRERLEARYNQQNGQQQQQQFEQPPQPPPLHTPSNRAALEARYGQQSQNQQQNHQNQNNNQQQQQQNGQMSSPLEQEDMRYAQELAREMVMTKMTTKCSNNNMNSNSSLNKNSLRSSKHNIKHNKRKHKHSRDRNQNDLLDLTHISLIQDSITCSHFLKITEIAIEYRRHQALMSTPIKTILIRKRMWQLRVHITNTTTTTHSVLV